MEDRAILRQFRHGCTIGGAIRHGRRLGTLPAFVRSLRKPHLISRIPHPCWRPQCVKSRGYGGRAPVITTASEASLHFHRWPVCQPRVAAGRLEASGGWRLAAWLALEWLRVGCNALIIKDASRRWSGGVFRFGCDQQGATKVGPGAWLTFPKNSGRVRSVAEWLPKEFYNVRNKADDGAQNLFVRVQG